MTRLAARLAEGLAYSDEFGGGLSNHEPMVLTALARLVGADDPALDRFVAAYRPRLEPLAGVPPTAARYAAAIARDGWEAVTRAALARLGDALPAAAGHGLLRVYFALEARRDLPPDTFAAELARGLGYFDDKQLRLYDGPRGTQPMRDGLRALPGLSDDERESRFSRALLITTRQERVAAHPQFRAAVAAIAPPAELLPPLMALAATATRTPDFTLLHALTTGQALLALETLLPGDDAPLRRGWVDFVLAAMLTQGLHIPADEVRDDGSSPAADYALVADCAARGGDHDVKVLFALARLDGHGGDGVFRAAMRAFVPR